MLLSSLSESSPSPPLLYIFQCQRDLYFEFSQTFIENEAKWVENTRMSVHKFCLSPLLAPNPGVFARKTVPVVAAASTAGGEVLSVFPRPVVPRRRIEVSREYDIFAR